DVDSAGFVIKNPEVLVVVIAIAVGDGEAAQDGVPSLVRYEHDHGPSRAAVNRGDRRPAGAGDGNRLAHEINIFIIGTRRDEHRVAIRGKVDRRLDGRLVDGDVDGFRPKSVGREGQKD